MNDKIKQLQEQIEIEKRKISNCKHIFSNTFYNLYTEKEAAGFEMKAQGSDVYYEPTYMKDVTKPRWTRKCKICGYEKHTEKQKPIISGNEPDFN